ncbi:MAG: uracil-DNA glycosylase [Deltaproteobacteria bacterium]|nr:uracil-DNA glycosylase [Deltaproteobacteria bacterium]
MQNYLLYLKGIGIEELSVQKTGVSGLPSNVPIGGQGPALECIPDGTLRGQVYRGAGVRKTDIELKGGSSSLADETLTLKSVREELGNCRRCKLHQTRTNIVFGVGNPNANLVFVGEGPGEDEDIQGEPFVGRAGQLLTRIINAMGLKREDVYICNVVKCRPPGNRNPGFDEIMACRPFLEKQIDAIKPKILVALGNHAAQTLLNTTEKITYLRGRFYWYRNGIQIMPTFHPSYLLRNEGKKKEVWEDMKMALRSLGLKIPEEKK